MGARCRRQGSGLGAAQHLPLVGWSLSRLFEFLDEALVLGVRFFDLLRIVLRGGPPGYQVARLQETELTTDLPDARFDLRVDA